MYTKNVLAVAFIDPTIPAQQGQEATLAAFRRSIVSQPATTPYVNWRNLILTFNPAHEFIVYQEQKQRHPTSGTGPGGGPGYDVLRAAAVGDTAGINAARDAMCLRAADGSFVMAGAMYLYDPRIPLFRQRVVDAWAAVFNSYVDSNGKSKYIGGFLDNFGTWVADTVDPILTRELYNGWQQLAYDLRIAFPDKIWIGNSSDSYRALNGEMCENRLTSWNTELAAHVGQTLPRADVGVLQVAGGSTDAQIQAQMAIAFAKGAWFGYSKTYQQIEPKDYYA